MKKEKKTEACELMGTFSFKLILSHVILFFIGLSSAVDSITQSQSLTDGNTLLSQGKTFELGFFSPATSKNRYLGIWSKNIAFQTVIWVANQNNPINDSSGNLVINKTGNILLLSQNRTLVWSATLLNQVRNPILQLLDSGNLILREETDANPDKYSWQSFDYSTDSLSVSNHYYVPNKSLAVIMALNNQSDLNYCDNRALCGPYGYCNISTSPVCKCLNGFKPRVPDRWNSFDNTDGCEREEPLNCGGGNNSNNSIGFEKYTDSQGPDGNSSWVDRSLSLEECRTKCLSNCSCSAYGNAEFVRGTWSGCGLWFGDLINLKALPEGGQDIYVRMLASEIVVTKNSESNRKRTIGVVTGCSIASILAILLFGFFIYRKRSNFRGQDEEKEEFELPSFDLSTISYATDNFSTNNKLGQGGFGPVYKGRLANGQEIAVKRLSKNSGQGMNEFKNEVILFSKLQHRNLVRLLGCCLQGEEKMLIYEYLPNKSLDFFIFDETKGKLLGWSIRFRIICGIARGLLYLHRDSRLRIIHRDLKASNILLDGDMNPKISDFGLARTFGGDQTEASTRRVVGTYGYMAPEYAIDGQFSVKSDVFSFGILLLEIISGKRNRGFYRPNHNDLNLIGYAWTLWNQGRPAELIDEIIDDSWSISEVLRCIHVGLLCAQQHPEDRPTMSSVVMMLGSDNIALPPPKQPGFFVEEAGFDNIEFQSRDQLISANELSVTVLEPR